MSVFGDWHKRAIQCKKTHLTTCLWYLKPFQLLKSLLTFNLCFILTHVNISGKLLHLTSTLKMASNNWSHNDPKVKYRNEGETLEGGIITADLKISQKNLERLRITWIDNAKGFTERYIFKHKSTRECTRWRSTFFFSSNVCPQFKCSIVRTSADPLSISRNVAAHQSTVVTFQRG